jgi:DNA replication protein DnaC
MSAAFDHLTSDELVPPWADDEAPSPAPIATGESYDFAALAEQLRRAREAWRYTCGACGQKVAMPGLCARCAESKRLAQKEVRDREACARAAMNAMPESYRCPFEDPDFPRRVRDHAAIDAIKLALQDGATRITLSGGAGAGKSTLATAAAMWWAPQGKLSVGYADARELAIARQRTPLGAEPALVKRASEVGLLMLDDLGLDAPEQYGSAVVDVVYERHRHCRLLIVTLACTPGELSERYGSGFARRLLEDDGRSALVEVRRP